MFRACFLLLAVVFVSGCSSKPSELQASTPPTIRNYSENYQEIYRRLATTAKRCVAGNTDEYSSMNVDTQLYSELGYGEVFVSMKSMGISNYYLTAKIEKVGTGAKLTIHSGNSLGAARSTEIALAWAGGDDNCPLI